MRRSKLILLTDAAILSVIEETLDDAGNASDTLVGAVRIPRADFLRLITAAVQVQAGQQAIFYGDGRGETAEELPLQTTGGDAK